ncbi:hypothetical protein [Arcanobacterium haemolyticum]|uniref:hypothetical protein n=1 Tax=Arcanobacterium haemolyticum TaxID=28264 RepID=UPI0015EBDAEB|nr:hypothetical protein [Arcanobacterium haemolyticum]
MTQSAIVAILAGSTLGTGTAFGTEATTLAHTSKQCLDAQAMAENAAKNVRDLEKKIADLMQNTHGERAAREAAQKAIAELQKESARLAGEIEKAMQEVAKSEAHVNGKSAVVAKAQKTLNDAKHALTQAETELANAKAELEKLKKEAADAKDAADKLQAEHDAKEAENKKLTAEENRRVEKLDGAKKKTQQDFEDAKDALNASIAKLDLQNKGIETIKANLEDAQKRFDELDARFKETEKTYYQKEHVLKTKAEKLLGTQYELGHALDRASANKEKKEKAERELEYVAGNARGRAQALNHREQELAEFKAEHARVVKEAADLRSQFERIVAKAAEENNESPEIAATLAEIEHKILQLTGGGQVQRLEVNIAKYSALVEKMRDELGHVQAEANRLISEIKEYESESQNIARLKSEITTLRQEIDELRGGIEELGSLADKTDRERNLAMEEISKLNSELKLATESEKTLSNIKDNLKEDYESAKKHFENVVNLLANADEDARKKQVERQNEVDALHSEMGEAQQIAGEVAKRLKKQEAKVAELEAADLKKKRTDAETKLNGAKKALEAAQEELKKATSERDELLKKKSQIEDSVKGKQKDLATIAHSEKGLDALNVEISKAHTEADALAEAEKEACTPMKPEAPKSDDIKKGQSEALQEMHKPSAPEMKSEAKAGELAKTGIEGGVLFAGLAMVGAGATLAVASRRRRQEQN